MVWEENRANILGKIINNELIFNSHNLNICWIANKN